MRVFVLCSFLACTLVVGCGVETGQFDQVSVADSAGVTIHSSSGTKVAEPLDGILSPEPHLRIGTIAGGEESQFSAILDAVRLSDGRLVVAESGARRVRVFDPDGVFVTWIGQIGDGPNEYASVGGVGVLDGDTIWIHDSRRRHLTLFRPDGEFVRGFSPERSSEAASPRRSRFLTNGVVVDESTTFDLSQVAPGTETYREEVLLSVMDREGLSPMIVGRVPGALYRLSRARFPDGRETTGFTTGLDDRFGAVPFFAIGDSKLYRADPATFEIRELSTAGVATRIVRISFPRLPLTPEMVDAYEDRVANTAPDRINVEQRFQMTTYADSVPHFQDVLVDDDEALWLGEYVRHLVGDPRVDSGSPRRWWRVGRDGMLEGFVDLPAGSRLLRIQADEFLGVTTDEMDVPYVVAYRFTRN